LKSLASETDGRSFLGSRDATSYYAITRFKTLY
jgi:hypothetical protein